MKEKKGFIIIASWVESVISDWIFDCDPLFDSKRRHHKISSILSRF